MNEGELSPTSFSETETTSPLLSISERGHRRFLFNGHVLSCPKCGDDANELCDSGHRLLRQAIE